MKKITSRKKLFLYGCAGMGVNMLTLMIGTYLCSALLTGGFDKNVELWTYKNQNLVIPAVWSALILVAKIIDGVIDIPMSSFTDNLKTRWGRRRPAIVIGFVPMIIAYLLFLIPLQSKAGILNTLWFGAILCIFYAFYTLTMLTYYATFSEITANEKDTVFVSNVKSVCDIVYFVLGYALLPMFVSLGLNIRIVALIFLPLSLTMLIPLFLLKEKPTKGENAEQLEATKPLNLFKAIGCSFKNKTFIYWMFTAAVTTFGLQLFLGGINELFSTMGLNMTVVMAVAFAPVPLTIWIYNKVVKKFGLGIAYKYILSLFALGMIAMFFAGVFADELSTLEKTMIAISGSLLASFSIGAFFSVSYTVPSHLARLEYEEKGISVASMYFAVQGLFDGVAAGLGTGVVLVQLKAADSVTFMPLIVSVACLIAFGMSFGFSKKISEMGMENGKLPISIDGAQASANNENLPE